MSLAGVANFVRVYRQQQATIEREYQDSFSVAAKDAGLVAGGGARVVRQADSRRRLTLATLTSSLLEGIDSLFGVLDAQAGTYTVDQEHHRFEDAGAAREFTALRQRIMDTWSRRRRPAGGISRGR